ncbi:hypothetical protein F5J12DRAFT_786405 [Pisolithus orientalis]|uniref:uncharacterized protein n=1 Tax=Pisolithus orientalis TaxID=936130 RepID=UPI002224F3AE|nr:uncharacterized protein F5J12DRAFT_786405 [Pisolithus orientalis]KAI5991072.1 hypothetical protein F5J12DRAFT_786405 [Pisolithus orientalis]
MKDQAITSLSAALRHIRVLMDTVPQPEESLEVIYEWVEDWDQTWAGIYSWWKYVNENKISILKVCNANLHNMTKESAIQQNEVIPVAIAIVDLWQPEGQHRFNIDNLFEDYRGWVEERVRLEAKRLAKAPSMHTWGQAARGEGQDCAPEDTKGYPSRGAACLTGGALVAQAREKGNRRPPARRTSWLTTSMMMRAMAKAKESQVLVAGDNEPCKTCAQGARVVLHMVQESEVLVLVLLWSREKVPLGRQGHPTNESN